MHGDDDGDDGDGILVAVAQGILHLALTRIREPRGSTPASMK